MSLYLRHIALCCALLSSLHGCTGGGGADTRRDASARATPDPCIARQPATGEALRMVAALPATAHASSKRAAREAESTLRDRAAARLCPHGSCDTKALRGLFVVRAARRPSSTPDAPAQRCLIASLSRARLSSWHDASGRFDAALDRAARQLVRQARARRGWSATHPLRVGFTPARDRGVSGTARGAALIARWRAALEQRAGVQVSTAQDVAQPLRDVDVVVTLSLRDTAGGLLMETQARDGRLGRARWPALIIPPHLAARGPTTPALARIADSELITLWLEPPRVGPTPEGARISVRVRLARALCVRVLTVSGGHATVARPQHSEDGCLRRGEHMLGFVSAHHTPARPLQQILIVGTPTLAGLGAQGKHPTPCALSPGEAKQLAYRGGLPGEAFVTGAAFATSRAPGASGHGHEGHEGHKHTTPLRSCWGAKGPPAKAYEHRH